MLHPTLDQRATLRARDVEKFSAVFEASVFDLVLSLRTTLTVLSSHSPGNAKVRVVGDEQEHEWRRGLCHNYTPEEAVVNG